LDWEGRSRAPIFVEVPDGSPSGEVAEPEANKSELPADGDVAEPEANKPEAANIEADRGGAAERGSFGWIWCPALLGRTQRLLSQAISFASRRQVAPSLWANLAKLPERLAKT
jgi:hypothetical protein